VYDNRRETERERFARFIGVAIRQSNAAARDGESTIRVQSRKRAGYVYVLSLMYLYVVSVCGVYFVSALFSVVTCTRR
jgi:hypothetical protein